MDYLEGMKRITIILLLFLPFTGFSQLKKIGTPQIINYSRLVYQAGTQNWGISQDQYGFMYFANNEGVLIFDGFHWEQVVVSQAKPVRSIYTDSKNTTYIGFFNDFGMLQPGDSSLFIFESFRHMLPEGIDSFDEIWKIHEIPQGIVFQTFDYLFLLKNDELKVIKPKNRFRFSFNVNGRLYLHEPGVGLFEFTNGLISEVPWADELKDEEINTMLEVNGNQFLIGTSGSGIYNYENGILDKWDTPANRMVEESKLYCASDIISNHLAFGTILGGLIISDHGGNIIQHLSRNNGLQNNTVLSIYPDMDENLWLGLDNGIDYAEINSPISYYADFEGIGTGYCSQIFEDKLYLGTNQGLFVKPFDNHSYSSEEFELVENTAGQVWSLSVIDDQLLCGHNLGTFIINHKVATKICDEEGGWKYIRLNNNPDLLLGGHFHGLVLYKKGINGWKFYKKIKGFNEPCRFLEQGSDGTIWVSHGAKGIFQIRLNENLDSVDHYKLYNSKDGLPSDELNIVFCLNNEILFSTIDKIYQFSPGDRNFQKSEKLNKIFNLNSRLKTFLVDNDGNIWYIAQDETGVLRLNEDSTYTKITSPFKQLEGTFVNEFEVIYPYNMDHTFIGLYNGFAHYSSKFPKNYSKEIRAYITKIELPYLDSILFIKKTSTRDMDYIFPFPDNSIMFSFTSPYYENLQSLNYSYFLDNFSQDWSDWSINNFKEYTNLHEGKYVFNLKAKNVYGTESEISTFEFTIAPPWFRSRTAWFSYFFVIFLFLFLAVRYIQYRMKLAKMKEKQKYQLELKKKEEQFQQQAQNAEKEIIRLRNEHLQAEMVHRDKELANQTMNIIQKNRLFTKLKDELNLVQKSQDNPQLKTKMSILIRRLDKEIDLKEQNKIFETYFEEVHSKFFERLKDKHPGLSPREMYLCAYIRMNLSTKEVSDLLNITSRGVEISRYRLRKKLELTRDINLSTYLSNL